jgi:hypothetical protein
MIYCVIRRGTSTSLHPSTHFSFACSSYVAFSLASAWILHGFVSIELMMEQMDFSRDTSVRNGRCPQV